MTRAVRLLAAALVLVAGCASDPSSGPAAGTLAYFSGGGEVSVIDFESGDTVTFDVSSGEPRGLALSPDGKAVAFIVRRGLRRHVYRGDVATGEVEEISPPARGDALVWGDGFFLYRVRVDGRNGEALVRDGETEARMIAEQIVVAAEAPTIAYVSDDRVFVESVATGDRTEVASGPDVRPVLLTDDAKILLLMEPVDLETARLVRIEVDSGARTDLALLRPGGTYAGDTSLLSPDESEVTVGRFDEIRAVRMDGGGERTVWIRSEEFTIAVSAGFTPAGDIVIVLEENLTPHSDTPELLEHLWLERDGSVEPLLEDMRNCNGAVVSASGALLAWPCEDATHVFSVAEGAEILAPPGFASILGFDRDERGILLWPWSGNDLVWVDRWGDQEVVASPYDSAPSIPFDFVP